MKIQQWLFELFRKQSVTDGRTDGRTDNVKTVYPLQTKFAGGIKINQYFKLIIKGVIMYELIFALLVKNKNANWIGLSPEKTKVWKL